VANFEIAVRNTGFVASRTAQGENPALLDFVNRLLTYESPQPRLRRLRQTKVLLAA
jgi:hypothetical protein